LHNYHQNAAASKYMACQLNFAILKKAQGYKNPALGHNITPQIKRVKVKVKLP